MSSHTSTVETEHGDPIPSSPSPLYDAHVQSLKRNGADVVICDSHVASLTNPQIVDADAAGRAFFTLAPSWVVRLMRLRNALVGRLGFTTEHSSDTPNGSAPELPERFQVGDAVGAFSVFDRSDDELIMGADDQRITFRIGIAVETAPAQLRISTVGYANDRLGRAYLGVVRLAHGPIARLLTSRIATG